MGIIPGVDIEELFPKVVKAYEEELANYSVKKYTINETEYIYVVQDTSVIYLGIVDMGYTELVQKNIVFEELLCDESFFFNASGFFRKFHLVQGLGIWYFKFHGRWANPIRGYNNSQYNYVKDQIKDENRWFVASKAEYVNDALPELCLKKRYEEWQGFLFHVIFYEVKSDGIVGYAEYCTKNPAFHKVARSRVKDLEHYGMEYIYSIQTSKRENEEFITQIHGPGVMVFAGVNCDYNLMQILKHQYFSYEAELQSGAKRRSWVKFIENGLQYFCIPFYSKSDIHLDLVPIVNGLFRDVSNGKYDELDRYNYILPVNKWKSEQLVYELTKRAYKNSTVIYQHRPYFLQTKNGQMSYDVFICKLNVAIEYQGKQHFEPVEIFGGQQAFEEQKKRDELKKTLSDKNGIHLVYINYWEDISIDLINKKVSDAVRGTHDEEAINAEDSNKF